MADVEILHQMRQRFACRCGRHFSRGLLRLWPARQAPGRSKQRIADRQPPPARNPPRLALLQCLRIEVACQQQLRLQQRHIPASRLMGCFREAISSAAWSSRVARPVEKAMHHIQSSVNQEQPDNIDSPLLRSDHLLLDLASDAQRASAVDDIAAINRCGHRRCV